MIEPLRLSFEVRCSAAHAFDVWTSRIGRWWPADHTVSGQDHLLIVLEGRPGGRIFERTPSGSEFDWGQVTVWDPPRRLVYQWHLRQDRPTRPRSKSRLSSAAIKRRGSNRAPRVGAPGQSRTDPARRQRRRLEHALALLRQRALNQLSCREPGTGRYDPRRINADKACCSPTPSNFCLKRCTSCCSAWRWVKLSVDQGGRLLKLRCSSAPRRWWSFWD